jgi:hypothetical protein
MCRRNRISSSAQPFLAQSARAHFHGYDSLLNSARQAAFSFAILALAALCGSSCAVPIAPGYQIRSESLAVQFVPPGRNDASSNSASPDGASLNDASLRVRAEYALLNSGNSDLKFVDTALPSRQTFGASSVLVEVDGREVAPQELPSTDAPTGQEAFRIALDPAWEQKQARRLNIEYMLSSPADSGARITLGADNFHLGSRGWFPVLEPPKHILSSTPKRPKQFDYTVRVPASFLIIAAGRQAKRKSDGDENEYRFAMEKEDLNPYIVAGKYTKSPGKHKQDEAIFWTLQPLKDAPAQAQGTIEAIWESLQKEFGPLDARAPGKNPRGPYIIEAPTLRGHYPGEIPDQSGAAAASFPNGAIVNSSALAPGTGSGAFTEIISHAFAHDWFGDEIYPAPESALGLGEGLPEYATIVVDEDLHGEDARRASVQQFLHEYDDARRLAPEKPLIATMLTDPAGPRRIALAKAPLFFIALEDACGKTAMQGGLARMVTLLRGQDADYNSLRSALEESSGKNLATIFRAWLNDTDIPADFRARYQ